MAAELVGGAFLSSLFGKLFDKLDSPEYLNFFRGLKLDSKLLKKLKIMLCSANQVLDDAEMKQLTNPNVREWLFELKDAICAAEELLDDINYETLRYEIETKSASRFKKLKSTISSSYITFDQAIEEILDRLEFIVKQKDDLGLKQDVTSRPSQRLHAPLADESCVYGRDVDKEKIIMLLLSENDNSSDKISVIPIVGMGGIGKTTLAQLVFEDERVKNHFHIRSWVIVSDVSDISKIAKQILEEITSRECKIEGPYQLQRKLKEALEDKRFLFVLDDVWNDNYDHWEFLLSSVRSGADGSKIIVTTRCENVANKLGNVPTYHLETVSDDDCWTLFKQHAFKDTSLDEHKDLHVIGKDIVKKCKGLPLAVKSLAGLLRSVTDPEEWKGILHDDIWERQLQGNQDSNILPSLWLSYHYLPSHLKRCFAYCSIFPKDYEMNEHRKEEIILLWMAEGLLQFQPRKSGVKIEDVGKEYFQDLISRSLFQPLSTNKSTILMHDLTHDLAVFASGEFSYRLPGEDKVKFPEKTRYFSYSADDGLESFEGLSAAKSIRCCLQLSSPFYRSFTRRQELEQLLLVGGCLRALSVSIGDFRVLPHAIGNLKHMRYLDFSYSDIEEIPNALCSLYNLQTLRLSGCRQLTQLPTEMGNLVKLRHLDIKGVPLKKMPPNMCNLEDLQTLSHFVLCKTGGSNIKELSGLRHLSGKLEISQLQIVDVVDNVTEANLMDKGYLKELVYSWFAEGNIDGSSRDIEVLDALQPHTNLERLSIKGYRGEALSKWLIHRSYTKMVVVRLHFCRNLCLLPSFGQLPSLQSLEIISCPRVERIGVEFYYDGGSSNIKPFRSLKSLEFKYMEEWQQWSFPEVHEDGGCFPSLECLRITSCAKLNVCLRYYFPSLKLLEVESSAQIALPPTIQQVESAFPSLEFLFTSLCPRLETFLLSNFPSNLKTFIISGRTQYPYQPTKDVPPCLKMKECENVIAFPEALLPNTLTSLFIEGLRNLKALNWESIHYLTCLEELRISGCEELRCISGEMLPTSLTSLTLSNLQKIKDLGKGLSHVTSLKRLKICNCQNFRRLSENELPTSLTSLKIASLKSLEDIGRGFFRHLIILEELEIFNCKNLQYNNSNSLEEEEENTGKRGLQHLISLKKLSIQHSEGLQSLLEEGLPTSLTFLSIGGFPNLRDLNRLGFQHLNSLEELQIRFCKNLECLPEEGLPSSLSLLSINYCPLLEARYERERGQDWHKISHIPNVHIDGNLLFARLGLGLRR